MYYEAFDRIIRSYLIPKNSVCTDISVAMNEIEIFNRSQARNV